MSNQTYRITADVYRVGSGIERVQINVNATSHLEAEADWVFERLEELSGIPRDELSTTEIISNELIATPRHYVSLMEDPRGRGYVARCECGLMSVLSWSEKTVRDSLFTADHHFSKVSYRRFAMEGSV
jgi:hypothetical protein